MELLNAIGTGNIVGVGTAIALGGPGAVLWCWLNSESDRCTGIIGTDGKDTKKYIHNLDAKDDTPVPVVNDKQVKNFLTKQL